MLGGLVGFFSCKCRHESFSDVAENGPLTSSKGLTAVSKFFVTPSSAAGGFSFIAITQCSESERISAHYIYAISILDGYPVTPCHRLTLLRSHISCHCYVADAEAQFPVKPFELAKAKFDSDSQPVGCNTEIRGYRSNDRG